MKLPIMLLVVLALTGCNASDSSTESGAGESNNAVNGSSGVAITGDVGDGSSVNNDINIDQSERSGDQTCHLSERTCESLGF